MTVTVQPAFIPHCGENDLRVMLLARQTLEADLERQFEEQKDVPAGTSFSLSQVRSHRARNRLQSAVPTHWRA